MGLHGIVCGAVSNRELVILGTASQAPTRSRNHNGYFLRWDDEGLLFDPGEGTQRQMLFAGVTASQITRICVTHLHGDHCLGLPGVLARMSLDRVPHPVEVCYPAGSREVFRRLRHASLFRDVLDLRERRIRGEGAVIGTAPFRLEARALSHSVPTVGALCDSARASSRNGDVPMTASAPLTLRSRRSSTSRNSDACRSLPNTSRLPAG